MATLVPSRSARRIAGGNGGALTDADFRGCRWIEGEPKPLRRGMFCGRPVLAGESWCAMHRVIVFGEERSGKGSAAFARLHRAAATQSFRNCGTQRIPQLAGDARKDGLSATFWEAFGMTSESSAAASSAGARIKGVIVRPSFLDGAVPFGKRGSTRR